MIQYMFCAEKNKYITFTFKMALNMNANRCDIEDTLCFKKAFEYKSFSK